MSALIFTTLERGAAEITLQVERAATAWQEDEPAHAVEYLDQVASDCQTLSRQAAEGAAELRASLGAGEATRRRARRTIGDPDRAAAIVAQFNRELPVGTPVVYSILSHFRGTLIPATVRLPAQVDAAGQPVVFLNGVRGCVHCEHVKRQEVNSDADGDPDARDAAQSQSGPDGGFPAADRPGGQRL